jgi:hypothetical protein
MPRSPARLMIMIMIAFLCSLIFAIQYNINYILIVHAGQTPQLPGVKITSHVQNQQVPKGTLSITGVSTDNSTTDCKVYIILNEIKPYQRVNPTDNNNTTAEDHGYSTWNYTFTPDYATIQEGNNRMVSKITCIDHLSINNENLTKFNSLNVTGIRVADNAINSELEVPPPSELSTNLTYSDLVQSQDPDSTDANPDKQDKDGEDEVSTERDNEDDDLDDEDAGYSRSSREKDVEIDKDFIEELHDRVLDQVTEQLRESGIDFPR